MKKIALLLLSVAVLAGAASAQVMDDVFKQKILTISEQDFWSSLQPVKGLEKAIAAGQAGKRDLAYRLLGDYHRQSLARGGERLQAGDRRRRQGGVFSRKPARRRRPGPAPGDPRLGGPGDQVRPGDRLQRRFRTLRPVRLPLPRLAEARPRPVRDEPGDEIPRRFHRRHQAILRSAHGPQAPVRSASTRCTTSSAPTPRPRSSSRPTRCWRARRPSTRTAARRCSSCCSEWPAACTGCRPNTAPGNWQIVGAQSLYHTARQLPRIQGIGGLAREGPRAPQGACREGLLRRRRPRRALLGLRPHVARRRWPISTRPRLRHKALDAAADAYWQSFLKRGYQWFAASTAPGGTSS